MNADHETRPKRFTSLEWWTSITGVVTALSALVAVVALVVSVGAWLFPRAPETAETAGGCPQQNGNGRTALARSPWMGLEFYCGGERLPLYSGTPDAGGRDVTEVDVGVAPFEIHAGCDGEKIAICAWTDDSVFAGIRVGQEPFADPASPFAVGKGMADTAAGSGTLYLNKDAQNYFAEGRVAKLGNGTFALFVSGFLNAEDDTVPAPGDDVYLIVFADVGRDGAVDSEDFELVVLRR